MKRSFSTFILITLFVVVSLAKGIPINRLDSIYQQGIKFYYENEYEKSLENLNICIQNDAYLDDSIRIELYSYLVIIHFAKRDFLNMYIYNDKLKDLIDKEKHVSKYIDYLINQGIIHREYKQYDIAISNFDSAAQSIAQHQKKLAKDINIQASAVWLELHKANYYFQLNQFEKAEEHIINGQKQIKKFPIFKEMNDYFLFELAKVEMAKKNTGNAKNIYLQIIDSIEQNDFIDYDMYLDALLELGKINLQEDELIQAKEKFIKCLNLANEKGISKFKVFASQELFDLSKKGLALDSKLNEMIVNTFRKEINYYQSNTKVINNIVDKQNQINALNNYLILKNEELHLKKKNSHLLIFTVLLIGLIMLFSSYYLLRFYRFNKKIGQLNEDLIKSNVELKKTNFKLKMLNKNISKFSNLVAHDIKSPLRNINSYSQIISTELKENENKSIQEYKKLMNLEVKNLGKFIDDLLNYSTITSNNQVHLKYHTIYTLVKEAIKNNKIAIEEHKVEIALRLEHEILASKSLMIVCFQNIISNSIKYRNNEIKCKIEIESKSNKNSIEIYIKDNGIGIKEDLIDKIFEYKYRGAEALESGIKGQGIGLNTVKNIIELHGATIQVESKKGAFSKFILIFPKA